VILSVSQNNFPAHTPDYCVLYHGVKIRALLYENMIRKYCLWLSSPLLDLGRFFSFVISTQSVGLVGRGSARRKAATYTQNKLALSGIRTHGPSVRAGEDGLCLRLPGHCDWHDHDIYYV
jgi:hypothetical protein